LAQSLDIFRIQAEGGVRWIGTVESTWKRPRHSSKPKSAKQTGDFLVVNLETGHRMEIKAEPAAPPYYAPACFSAV